MARSGRKPKPTETKRRRGNPGKRALNDREPKPPAGAPPMPEVVFDDAEAASEWPRLCKRLNVLGLLNECDGNLMERYCTDFSLRIECVRLLRENGQVLISEKGGEYSSQYFNNFLALSKRLDAADAEMGLTPSSRTRILGPQEGDDDPLLVLLQQRLRRQQGSQN